MQVLAFLGASSCPASGIVVATSDETLLGRCRSQAPGVASVRSQDLSWMLEAFGGDDWGDARPRQAEGSAARKRDAAGLWNALARAPGSTDALSEARRPRGDPSGDVVAWVASGRVGLAARSTRKGNVLYDVAPGGDADRPGPGPGGPGGPGPGRAAAVAEATRVLRAYEAKAPGRRGVTAKDLVVVEGTHDASAVAAATRSTVDAFALRGSSVRNATELYERAAEAARRGGRVVVLCDPDFTGLQLRRRVDDALRDLAAWHAFVPTADATLKTMGPRANKRVGDVGVEHATGASIAAALRTARRRVAARRVFVRHDLASLGLAAGRVGKG